MKTSRTFQSLILFFITVVGVVVVLAVAEQHFKLLHFQKLRFAFTSDHFIRLRTLAPNDKQTSSLSDKTKMDSFELEIKDFNITTDSFGFIVTERNHPHPDLNFAFFGGSCTQCIYVDEDNRMPEAVARAVEKKTGYKINSWNCAAGGTHSYHTLNVLNNLALNLNPNYAFFYANANDIITLIHHGTYNNLHLDRGVFFSIDEYEKRYGVEIGGGFPFIIDAFKTRFNLKPPQDDMADIRGLKLHLDSSEIMTPIARVYRTIISSCKANNIKPVLITQRTNLDRLSHEWLLKNMPFFTPTAEEYIRFRLLFHQYNSLLRQIAKEENVMLIDLDGEPLGIENFYDVVHFNSKGSLAVSEMIATQFVEKAKFFEEK